MGKVIMFKKAIMVKATETLPNRIREWRVVRNMSMDELARIVGVSYPQMQRLETGVRSVDFDDAKKIAAALDVTVGDLLSKETNPYNPTERERRLLEMLREGGEPMMKAVEAIAAMQLQLVDDRRREADGDPADEEVSQSA